MGLETDNKCRPRAWNWQQNLHYLKRYLIGDSTSLVNLIGKNKRDVWDVNFVALCAGRCGACWEEHLAEVLAGTREAAKGSSTTPISVRVFIPVGGRWSVTDWADGVFHRCLICPDSQGHISQMKKASWWEGVARCRENALHYLVPFSNSPELRGRQEVLPTILPAGLSSSHSPFFFANMNS